jgi:hypothetical protein
LTSDGAVMVRESRPSQISPLNEEFWNLRIGRTLDTGFISQATSKLESCAIGEDCETFIYFSNSTGIPMGRSVDISCRSGDFKLLLSTKSADAYFPVRRVWFWDSSCFIDQGNDGAIKLVRGLKKSVLY